MKKYTEMTIYKVMYRCFKNNVITDEYAVGYFVSKEEARDMVLNDMNECGNSDIEIEKYSITGIDGKDSNYKHVYRLCKVKVGKTIVHDSIENLTRWY